MFCDGGLCRILSPPPHRDEAEMEYLKIAQDLEMYGVSYFAITVSVSRCDAALHCAWCCYSL